MMTLGQIDLNLKKFLNGTHVEENNYFVKEKRFKHQYNSRMKITLCPGKIIHIYFFRSSEQKTFYDTLLQRYHRYCVL